MTNMGFYVMLPPKGEPCPIEGPAEFCRYSPTLHLQFPYAAIHRLVTFPGCDQLILVQLADDHPASEKMLLFRFDGFFAQRQFFLSLQKLSCYPDMRK